MHSRLGILVVPLIFCAPPISCHHLFVVVTCAFSTGSALPTNLTTMAAAAAATATPWTPNSPTRWVASSPNALAQLRQWVAKEATVAVAVSPCVKVPVPPRRPLCRATPPRVPKTPKSPLRAEPLPAAPQVGVNVWSPMTRGDGTGVDAADAARPTRLQFGATVAPPAADGSIYDSIAATVTTAAAAAVAGVKRGRAALTASRTAAPHDRYCEHGRRPYYCKECGGSAICEHGRRRYRCKKCIGVGICEHGCVHSSCKECSGAGICEHGRQRYSCKECGGRKECDGSSICDEEDDREWCYQYDEASMWHFGYSHTRSEERTTPTWAYEDYCSALQRAAAIATSPSPPGSPGPLFASPGP